MSYHKDFEPSAIERVGDAIEEKMIGARAIRRGKDDAKGVIGNPIEYFVENISLGKLSSAFCKQNATLDGWMLDNDAFENDPSYLERIDPAVIAKFKDMQEHYYKRLEMGMPMMLAYKATLADVQGKKCLDGIGTEDIDKKYAKVYKKVEGELNEWKANYNEKHKSHSEPELSMS